MTPVHWTCPQCGHRNEWAWHPGDAIAAAVGETFMECEVCRASTRMALRAIGAVISNDTGQMGLFA